MKHQIVRLYRIILIIALIPALLLISLRLALPQVSRFSDEIAAQLSQQIGMTVGIGSIQASMEHWRIRLAIQQLSLFSQQEQAAKLSLKAEHLELTLDVLGSLQRRLPVFSDISVERADLLIQEYQGQWLAQTASPEEPRDLLALLLAGLPQQATLRLSDVSLGLQPEQGPLQLISPINALFEAVDQEYQLSGSIRIPQIGDDAYIVLAAHALAFDPLDPLASHWRFFLQSDALGPELLKLGLEPLQQFESLNLSTHLWGEWQGRELIALQGDVQIAPLQLVMPGWPVLEHFSMHLALLPLDQQRYQLQLQQIKALSGEDELNLPALTVNLQVDSQWQPTVELVQFDELDLASTHRWAERFDLLPADLAEVISTLSPSGKLLDLVLVWQDPNDLESLLLQATLQDVAVSAWEDAPSASGIQGEIHTDLKQGKLRLESAAFSLGFPELFGSNWIYSEASGDIYWQLDEDALRLNSGLLSLSNQDIDAKGRFGLYRPFDSNEQIEFTLLIGLTDTDALQTEFYTPPNEIGTTLYEWLKGAVKAGRINQAGLMVHAGLRPTAAPLPITVQLFLEAEDTEFIFDREWPRAQAASVFLHLRNTELRIDIASAKILNSTLQNAWVYLPPNSDRLNVAALMQGDASDFSRLLSESALGKLVGNAFDDWTLTGPTVTRLGLQLPVDNPEQVSIQVVTQLNGNRLHLQQRDLHFSDLTGKIQYTTAAGLGSEQLQGVLFGQRMTAAVSTQGDRTQVEVQGVVASDHLDQLTGLSLSSRLQGQSQAQVTLTLCSQSLHCPRIQVRSDLSGTAVDLPLSLGKSKTETRQLYVDLYPERQRFDFSYDRLLQGAFDLTGRLRGMLVLGEGTPHVPEGHFFDIRGELPEMSLQGRFEPLNADQWRGQLSHLHWRGSADDKEAPLTDTLLSEASQDFSGYPRLSLQIDALSYTDKPLGRWSLELVPAGRNLRFESIQGHLQGFTLDGHAHWNAGDFPSTNVTANLAGADLAEMLQLWHLGRPIETEQLTTFSQLSWRGAPWHFKLASLDGVFQFQAEQGRIIESGAGANILRIFGLLNLNTLSRRLRLDFSDLLQKGLVFDQLSAHYRIDKGIAILEKPLEMTGPSANMEITGQVNLNNHQLDKTIRVSVPLGSNLTLGAVLLGAPQVAGALFIFDRVMGDRIDKMTRIAYTLTGDWKDPQLNLLNPADR